jgi:hypothetical protein
VLELHGTTHRVVCMDCGAESCRHDMQVRAAGGGGGSSSGCLTGGHQARQQVPAA